MIAGSFIVFDVETTGFSPVKNEIIQFSAIKFRDYQRVADLSIYIQQLQPLPAKIVELTGITDEILVTHGVPPQTAYVMIMEFCKWNDIYIGHNINTFDWPFLMNFCDKYHDGRRFSQVTADKIIDTMKVGKVLMPGGKKWPKLSKLCELLHIEFSESEAHNAIYDVDRTAACLLELVKRKMVWA
jgi:DNA polymerase-3 subunit alpha (Gram-positive type)